MKSSLEYLYSLHKFGMKFGLNNIRSLLKFAGNPHKNIRTVHVAGTNGKGSTSSMIASILTAAGYKVGLYTSPHLVSFNERIRINGTMISNKDVIRYTAALQPQIDKIHATFFEAVTAMAFCYFADQKVDIAVIETGLGGRLDSTNVIHPLVSVITTIGKDHTELLGTTVTAIANEKAGIIKRKIPVVIGPISGSAKKIIFEQARSKNSNVVESAKLKLLSDTEIQLKGIHQIANAKTAIGAINCISKTLLIGDRSIREGLKYISKFSGLRARFEIIPDRPNILLDVAHNPDGIRILVQELRKLNYKKIVVIFAVMKDKDYRSILQQLKKIQSTIIATQLLEQRALPSNQLFSICKEMGFRVHHADTVNQSIKMAKKITGLKGLLVVTGSHYLVGEIIPILEKKS